MGLQTPLSTVDGSFKQKINNEMFDLNYILD